MTRVLKCYFFFFFNDTATTEIYTLSLHDALPISGHLTVRGRLLEVFAQLFALDLAVAEVVHQFQAGLGRSEEHTSELQSHLNLVCRLLLEKKKTNLDIIHEVRHSAIHTFFLC